MAEKFVHLHTHSHYSLLDGLSKIEHLIGQARADGMSALALTDHGAMYGAIEFYKAAKAAGIKPILGVEAYITPESRFQKRPNIDNKRFHLTLLAKNNTGYRNLMKLVTRANLEGYYYKPRMDKDLLRQHSDGLIALSGCLAGELERAIAAKRMDEAEQIALNYQDIFGAGNYFLEVQVQPGIEGQGAIRAGVLAIAEKLKIPIVGTQDSHYVHHDDVRAHETLLAVQQNTEIDDKDRLSLQHEDLSFIDSAAALEKFKDIPQAFENTQMIADMVAIDLELGKWVFPKYDETGTMNYDAELEALAFAGIDFRGMERTKALEDRVRSELDIIKNKGYSPYFLVVGDLLRFAREHGILTNTRGSAAGSMVSYLTGITTVDPLRFKLPFERFLNPYRPSPPDVDMDFADDRRYEVIAYAKKRYGEDKVAQIGTFGTMMARGAVRDVARALGHPYATGDRISKLIPLGSQGFPMTIDHALEVEPELETMYEKEPDTREIIDLAKKLEGCARHASIHAAGVVIAPTPLTDFTPLQHDPHGEAIITQYDMHAVEDAGLLKFDFLGIKNLTILSTAVATAKETQDASIDIEKIPFDDAKTYEMLARGETMGLFQLNGSGMTRYLVELKPTVIDDINAMVALYRPGPMDVIPDYIKRKNNPEAISYPDPRMRQYLEASYGLIVYQDDLLFSAIELAGYTWEEADKFRKAVGKKIPAEMTAQKEKLVKGIIANGQTKEFAEKLWKLFEPFQAYGFNKAHAASYGHVAYQTAYMKANYPAEYMAAALTADAGDVEKISEAIIECKRMGIDVLAPDVNESFGTFTVVKGSIGDKIRFGLYSIKNFGTEIANAIIEERKMQGKYRNFSDLLERVLHRNLNKKSLESLLKAGALDSLGDRSQMLGNLEEALAYNKELQKAPDKQASLFGDLPVQAGLPGGGLRMKAVQALSLFEMLAGEKELLGLYVSGHPLEAHREKLSQNPIAKAKEYADGTLTVIGGVIEEAKNITTKNGEHMAFLKLADLSDRIELVIFPRLFAGHKELCVSDKLILVKGRISSRNGTPSIIGEAIKELV